VLPARRATGPLPGRRSSGPLVGELRLEITDQGNERGTHKDGSRTLPRSRLLNSALGAFGRPGVHPESSILGECCLAQERILRCLNPELVGGDEETRTPDPLLAKEMLCQLSYVPLPGWNGGRFWTRTRDLCLIRAVL
jgi:hypothetical protein